MVCGASLDRLTLSALQSFMWLYNALNAKVKHLSSGLLGIDHE